VFVLSDQPAFFAPFSRCSYTDYARKVMFSLDRAFQRRFEAYDQVLFTKVSISIQHIVSAEISGDIAFSESSESSMVVITTLES
jgi:hypothetical protein